MLLSFIEAFRLRVSINFEHTRHPLTTMHDVAKRASVALSTVSYAINGTRPITETTRQRVFQAMDELGYRPHALARRLASKPSRILALLFPILERGLGITELDFFTAESLRKVLVELWEIQKTTVIMVSHYVDEAVSLSDRIVVFSDRPGTIVDIIENKLARPRNHRAKNFFAIEDKVLAQLGKK